MGDEVVFHFGGQLSPNGLAAVAIARNSIFFFFQAEDGIRDVAVTGVQTCALPIFRFGALGRLVMEKKKAFVESITSGNFHNQAAKGAESALSCMLARTAAYKGHEVDRKSVV